MSNRKTVNVTTRMAVLHEAGYKCGNPACHGIITLDIHHIEQVSAGGGNGPENLLPLCPTCHARHHSGQIPAESIRTWKMLLLSLNAGFPRGTVDLLLALEHLGTRPILLSLDTLMQMGSLLSSGLIDVAHPSSGNVPDRDYSQTRFVALSAKGTAFVAAWKAGNQAAAVDVFKEPEDHAA